MDKKVARFIFRYWRKTKQIPTAPQIAEKFEFKTRQAGNYYLGRMVAFGALLKIDDSGYVIPTRMPDKFAHIFALTEKVLYQSKKR